MASIGFGTIASSQLQAKGYSLLKDTVNANTKYGIFTTDGELFYLSPLGSKSSETKTTKASTTIGGKVLDAMSGALASFEKSWMPNTSVEAGVVDLNYSFTSDITDAPLMNGQFLPFNKVIRPIQAQVNYVTTGTEKQRKFFENALKKAQPSFGLFTLHTGELSIPYVNITGASINRNKDNPQMYNISIAVRQVMIKANDAALGNATAGSGTAKESGTLQTTAATGSQVQAAQKTQDIESGGLY